MENTKETSHPVWRSEEYRAPIPARVVLGFLIPAIVWLVLAYDPTGMEHPLFSSWGLLLTFIFFCFLVYGFICAVEGKFWFRWLCMLAVVFIFVLLCSAWAWVVVWSIELPLIVSCCLFFSPTTNNWFEKQKSLAHKALKQAEADKKALRCPHCGGDLAGFDVTVCCHCGRDVKPVRIVVDEGSEKDTSVEKSQTPVEG